MGTLSRILWVTGAAVEWGDRQFNLWNALSPVLDALIPTAPCGTQLFTPSLKKRSSGFPRDL